MTSNVRNQGIAHLAFHAGGVPFCKSRRAHIVVASNDRGSWPICKRCEAKVAKLAATKMAARTGKAKVGDERWTADHVSYKRWCEMATKRGWNGEDGADGLREYCEPEEAAIVTVHASLDAAKTWAIETFNSTHGDDSAFGAILIEHQVLEGAHDDSGNPVRGCPPTWETQKTYEVTSDGEMIECGHWS